MSFLAYQMPKGHFGQATNTVGKADPAFCHHLGTIRAQAANRGPYSPASRRENQNDVKEDAYVEFQGCGSQSTRSGQGGQTYKFDGARRQAGLRRLRHSGSEGGGGQIRRGRVQNRDRDGLSGGHEDRLARYSPQDRSRWRDGRGEDRR